MTDYRPYLIFAVALGMLLALLALGGCAGRDGLRADVTAAGYRQDTAQQAHASVQADMPAGRDSNSRTVTAPITISGSAWPLVVVMAATAAVLIWMKHRLKNQRRHGMERLIAETKAANRQQREHS